MLTTVQTLALLAARYPSDAATARALGISRQALALARQRNALSDRLIFAAATALDLDPGTTLAEIRASEAPDDATKAVWRSIYERLNITTTPNTNYAKSTERKKSSVVHGRIPLSAEKEAAYRLLQWCLCVPKISPDSPRLAYYASRWNVPDKIARALADGRFDEIIKDCPPIDLRHLPAAFAALDECDRYAASITKAPETLSPPQQTRLHARKSKTTSR